MSSVTDREKVKRVHREVENEVKAKAKSMVAEKLGAGMSATVSVRMYKKRPAAFGNFERDVVQLFLLGQKFLDMSNAELAAHMSGKFGGFEVPASLFYAPLKPWAKKAIRSLLAQHERKVDLSGKPTLSSIKKALRGDAAKRAASRVYQASFSFTDQSVVVNGRDYPIVVTDKGYRRIRVNGGQWISVDNLEALLGKPSLPFLSE